MLELPMIVLATRTSSQNKEDNKVPALPATDGLPVWAQILISLLVCFATLAVAFKGYFGKEAREAKTTAVGVDPHVLINSHGDLTKGLRDLEREICDHAEELRENRLMMRRSSEYMERLISSLDHNSRCLERHAVRLGEQNREN